MQFQLYSAADKVYGEKWANTDKWMNDQYNELFENHKEDDY